MEKTKKGVATAVPSRKDSGLMKYANKYARSSKYDLKFNLFK
jgi:hypothetical protein